MCGGWSPGDELLGSTHVGGRRRHAVEMTRERMEMLGTTFIPQHSDARILEQVIYKCGTRGGP
jgi:hypothetical protein